MPSDESKGSQLDAIGSLAQRQLDNTAGSAERASFSVPVSNLDFRGERLRRRTTSGYAVACLPDPAVRPM